jgi:hypothetical protein
MPPCQSEAGRGLGTSTVIGSPWHSSCPLPGFTTSNWVEHRAHT